ncbi:recombination-associated protein RdgC [Leeia sp. TBRC 13508]|uniref:Recombination-associated protein RdgC n=1 Tax=Leeia speluncae TaxID=2884804 RepID=A0ABS8D538_9NEIS|nr:recombination-associated protein RdgC [Leeia speluncae]MCB6183118.1 recombination-associated protein RdgC [Leeia speluncae]
MWFKNLQLYRLTAPLSLTAEELTDKLSPQRFAPCSKSDKSQAGWSDAFGCDELVISAGGALWCVLKTEEKILPSSVINQELQERMDHIQATEARRVGKKEKQTLKEQIEDTLLPQAFSRFNRIAVMLDPVSGWVLVDAGNMNKAEQVISALIAAIESLKMKRPEAAHSPASKMADLLLIPAEEQELQLFQLDSDCELKGHGDTQSVVRFARHDLLQPEVAAHLATGKQPVKLGLQWQDRISLMLTDDWQIKRLKFLELIQDELLNSDTDDRRAMVEATLTIQADALRKMLADLMLWLGEEMEEAETATSPAPAVSSNTAESAPWE